VPPTHAGLPPEDAVHLFAALGDDVRLSIVGSLSDRGPQSITELARHAPISRQAITKHLHVLESAGIATSERSGRERIWRLQAHRLTTAQRYLDRISSRWDDAIARLEAHLQEPA